MLLFFRFYSFLLKHMIIHFITIKKLEKLHMIINMVPHDMGEDPDLDSEILHLNSSYSYNNKTFINVNHKYCYYLFFTMIKN